jgi:hypothetical protein
MLHLQYSISCPQQNPNNWGIFGEMWERQTGHLAWTSLGPIGHWPMVIGTMRYVTFGPFFDDF